MVRQEGDKMKVTNYQIDNYRYIGDVVVRGSIKMTFDEFIEIEKYLKDKYQKALKDGDTYIRDELKYTKLLPDNGKVVMGVTATELVFKKYKLPRYKKQNYVWMVTR